MLSHNLRSVLFLILLGGTMVMGAVVGSASEASAKSVGEKMAEALPAPLPGWLAKEEVREHKRTKRIEIKRLYTEEKVPKLQIIVRTETKRSLKKRMSTFMDPAVVKAKRGEFKSISGQRFSILKLGKQYTAMTIVDGRISVLYFGTSDKSTLLAFIITTDFQKLKDAKPDRKKRRRRKRSRRKPR